MYIKVPREKQTSIPKVHFDKKHPITELKFLSCAPLLDSESLWDYLATVAPLFHKFNDTALHYLSDSLLLDSNGS